MRLLQLWKYKIIRSTKVVALINYSKRITLPGFEGVPLFDVIKFFIKGVQNSSLGLTATSLAFKFFLALFPGLIFIITLIPYIPIDNFQVYLMDMLREIMPTQAFYATKETFEDLILNKQSGLLSFGFLFALYLTTDGIFAMMTNFNESTHIVEKRSALKIRLISIMLVLVITVLLMFSILLIVMSGFIMEYLVSKRIITDTVTFYSLIVGKWIILFGLLFSAISLLYYWGPSGNVRYKFISAGSSLATLFIVLVSVGFAYYVNNFASYNKLYGSIGTIIVVMIWLNFNLFVVLLGYELNNSIYAAKHNILGKKKK